MKLHGTASDEVQEEIGSRNRTDDTHSQKVGSSILNGWLIEQVCAILDILLFVPGIIIPDVLYWHKNFILAMVHSLSVKTIDQG